MDDKIKEIIAAVAKELGITEFKTTKVVDNVFNYMKNSMSKLESNEYYIPKFGKFTTIKKRLTKYKESLKKEGNDKLTNKKADDSAETN